MERKIYLIGAEHYHDLSSNLESKMAKTLYEKECLSNEPTTSVDSKKFEAKAAKFYNQLQTDQISK